MHIIGLDVGKRSSQLCIGTLEGVIVRQVRVATTKEALSEALQPFLPEKVLLEASTSAEWIARHLQRRPLAVIEPGEASVQVISAVGLLAHRRRE